MKDIVRVAKALADPTRLKILKLLEQREHCVCEIQAALDIAQPTASKHLGILEQASLVDRRRDAKFVLYYPETPYANPHADALVRELNAWLGEQPEILDLLDKDSTLDRNTLAKQRNDTK